MIIFWRGAAPWPLGLLLGLAALLSFAPVQAQDRYSGATPTSRYDARPNGATTPYCCSGQDRVQAEDPADWVDPCNIDPQCPRYREASRTISRPFEPAARYETARSPGAMPPCPADRLAQIGCPPASQGEGLTLPASFFQGGGGVGPDYIGGGEGGVLVIVGGGGSDYASARASSNVSIRIGGGGRRGGHGGHGHPGKPAGGGCGRGH